MYAHRGTQISEQGDSILATEIHELDCLEARVEVHSFAFWVVALLGVVQVTHKKSGQGLGTIRNAVLLDHIASDFEEGRYVVGPLLNEPYHKRIIAQAQLLQVNEFDEVLGQRLQAVVMKEEGLEIGEVGELVGQVCDLVVTQDECCEAGQLSHLYRQLFQLVATQVQVIQSRNQYIKGQINK